jgi:HD domain
MVSRVAWVYIGLVVAAAAALVVTSWPGDVSKYYWFQLGVLQLLFLICDSAPAPLASRQASWSPSSAATLAAVVLLGPFGAALVGAVSVLSVRRKPRSAERPGLSARLAQRLFNGAMYALSGYAAGKTFEALRHYPAGHEYGPPQAGDFPLLVLPFAAAAIVHVLANQSLIWTILRLNRRSGQVLQRSGGMESSLPMLLASDLCFASLGLVIAALWSVINYFSAVIVLVPLFVARWAIAQFAEQQRAYQSTISALCQAVETKDFYTRGHSERVSRGSGMIARQVGMGHARIEAIKYAGMLHDVGKLGVPTQVLQKTGPLTEDEYAAIQLHPMRGLDIVREIGFLFEAFGGITHHHERIDGRGYPMGLAGHEIPIFARVIAVADAFDSMTSTRSYRQARSIPEAVRELRKGADTQFDPLIVDAFIAALEREGWQLAGPPVRPGDFGVVTAQDHDDPTTPLRVVDAP